LDPKILLLFSKIAHKYPELLKKIVYLPPVFHFRKHAIENVANDPVHLVTLLLPLYHDCLGLQRQKKRTRTKSHFSDGEKR
jgi:hypothetical protein